MIYKNRFCSRISFMRSLQSLIALLVPPKNRIPVENIDRFEQASSATGFPNEIYIYAE
jgi:hypothetical protein